MSVAAIIKEKWNNYTRKKRWWSVLLDFAFLILIVAMLIPSTRKSLSAFFVRQTLLSPKESSNTFFLSQTDLAFSFEDYNGVEHILEDKLDKPVFINFWATWCPPCIAEMPSLQNLYNMYKDDVEFIFISREDKTVVEEFIDKNNYDLPLYSYGGVTTKTFSTSTLPTTFLIGPENRVILYKTGAARWDSQKMQDIMNNLIDENTLVK
ncbi:TlpA disulfide reductase family protein [Marinilabiliaceae bacterium ANBcel2]|nr:TlpA disulfide reductase family protein [Marinilabiliaceae bacterium ANBcel2]